MCKYVLVSTASACADVCTDLPESVFEDACTLLELDICKY